MKGVIAAFCGMAVSVHGQFNVEIDKGFRFGVLGGQVVNIGGNNKGQPFKTGSWPSDILDLLPTPPQGPTPQRPNPNSAPLPQPLQRPPSIGQIIPSSKAKRRTQSMGPKIPEANLNTIVDKEIKLINKPADIVISESQTPTIKKVDSNDEKEEEIQIKPEKLTEQEKEKRQRDLLRKKQDERLAEFIKVMPEAQKQHLRAIATEKTQS